MYLKNSEANDDEAIAEAPRKTEDSGRKQRLTPGTKASAKPWSGVAATAGIGPVRLGADGFRDAALAARVARLTAAQKGPAPSSPSDRDVPPHRPDRQAESTADRTAAARRRRLPPPQEPTRPMPPIR